MAWNVNAVLGPLWLIFLVQFTYVTKIHKTQVEAESYKNLQQNMEKRKEND